MEFGILGPLLVRDETGVLAVPAAKQRTLMAALLLSAGRVVSVDRLVETLWDGRPPASAAPSLRNYVLRLRTRLGGAGRVIGFRDRGYVIEVDDDQVDLLRFARLRDEGAIAFERGDFSLAGRLLGRALEQWRGPALADVASDALHREEIPHLAEGRLDTMELWLDAESRAGRQVAWTPESRGLARAHPERERLWEHLLASLYANGRRAEALSEYRRMERILAHEYGVRPGDRPRTLYGRIDTSAAQPGRVVPFQIPAAPADFTGRTRETARLLTRLSGEAAANGAPIVIAGQPGIGKTALALHVAHELRDAFPGGVLYADLRASTGRPARAADVLASFLGTYGVSADVMPSALEDRTGLLRSLLSRTTRTLMVLDDVGDSSQVAPLLPGPDASASLMTSRARLDAVSGVVHVEPDALPAEDATRLMAAMAGAARTAAEPGAIAALVHACEGLPLAVRVVGARLAARPGRSVRWLAERLSNDIDVLFDEPGLGSQELRSGLAEVCRRLEPDEARAFRTLALADRDAASSSVALPASASASALVSVSVSVTEAARLLDVGPERAEQLLERLVDRYLLAAGRNGRYGFRPLTRAYGRSAAFGRMHAERSSAPW